MATTAYKGDKELMVLVKKAGSDLKLKDVKDIVDGVASAPQPFDKDAWQDLIAPKRSAALTRQLSALLENHRKALKSALDPKPSRKKRLAALRQRMEESGLDGFLVPRADEFQGEYVPEGSERLAFISGFTGSAGIAIVMRDAAALFVDGRYVLQADSEVDPALFDRIALSLMKPAQWLSQKLRAGMVIGYDAKLHTPGSLVPYRKACEQMGVKLTAVKANPLDDIWRDRPAAPLSPVRLFDLASSDRDRREKRKLCADSLKNQNVDAAVLSAPDSIAWLLDVRGADVPFTPVPLSFAVLYDDGSLDWFIDDRKLLPGVKKALGSKVRIVAPGDLSRTLKQLGEKKLSVLVDRLACPSWFSDRLQACGAKVVPGEDPCALPKACKTEAELAGMRAAHKRDGVALARFFSWLSQSLGSGTVDELMASDKVAALRAEANECLDLSFATIAGSGANGAIVHYRVNEKTNRNLELGSLFLLDSGGQYRDGTTDVTRTVAIGSPSVEMRDRFTRVLKGHIALASAVFPEGTVGSQLDILARKALWEIGEDFDHGTGHGVGCVLSVHEGPQRISKQPSQVALRPGMVLSNEPGFYKEGAYGIRIENLMAVKKVDRGPRPMLGFEVLTLVPIDHALINVSMLDAAECAWLNAYHNRVFDEISPLLDDDALVWLRRATGPLHCFR